MTDNRERARAIVDDWSKGDAPLAAAIESALDDATERGRMQGWSADEATVERVARAILRSYTPDDAEFEEAWADVDVVRHNRLIEARAAIAAIPAPPAGESERG